MKSTQTERLKALLVSIRTPDVTEVEAEESLSELERLVTTLGFDVVAKERQNRPSTKNSTVVGQGKLQTLALYTGGKGAVERTSFAKKTKAALRQEEEEESEDVDDAPLQGVLGEDDDDSENEKSSEEKPKAGVVVFDCDLTPSQLRNLEGALGTEVLDRSGVIIEIFSRHAKTRTAKLQVEIARLNYLAPRLRETGGRSERQAGQGAGESSLELDRRNIRDRVTELKSELAQVQREQESRRNMRSEQLCVALVGYTNAGKSSTMRALTGSQVLVEDKLFATLDTTVRAIHPETHPRILVSDTVGFIKKLPHDLVASFRSTLDEALNASLLLYVVDASDPTFVSQLKITREVLDEVGVEDTPNFVVLNKADRLTPEQRTRLAREFPMAIVISSRDPDDVKLLREKIVRVFEKDMVDEEIFAPYTTVGIVGEIRGGMRVIKEDFENEGVRFRVRARPADLQRLKKKFGL
ncbi:MAG: GTPase HflX [Bdellovibrionota bacterium]